MKHIAFLIILSFQAIICYSQQWRINIYEEYVFNDAIDYYENTTAYYNGVINGGLRSGIELEYKFLTVFGAGLLYQYQKTEIPLSYYRNGAQQKDFDMRINWIMGSGTTYLPLRNIEPYLSLLVGAAIIRLENADQNKVTSTKPAWGFRAGANWFFNKNFGVKAQTDLMSVIKAVGDNMVSNTGYTSSVQFGLGAGLVYRF